MDLAVRMWFGTDEWIKIHNIPLGLNNLSTLVLPITQDPPNMKRMQWPNLVLYQPSHPSYNDKRLETVQYVDTHGRSNYGFHLLSPYTLIADETLILQHETKKWKEAKEACQTLGMTLAIKPSDTDLRALLNRWEYGCLTSGSFVDCLMTWKCISHYWPYDRLITGGFPWKVVLTWGVFC